MGKRIIRVGLLSIVLSSLMLLLKQPYRALYNVEDAYIYSYGNADEKVRGEIIKQLNAFQDGYTHRDKEQVASFMEQLITEENIVVLGTMPKEIFVGQRDVSKLFYSDWNAWGDCTFLIDSAHISTSGNVAWIATIGYVKFDLPKFFVLPLRLSAVMVKENLAWKFHFIQYQFDLNLFPLFFTLVILSMWLAVDVLSLTYMIFKRILCRKPSLVSPSIC